VVLSLLCIEAGRADPVPGWNLLDLEFADSPPLLNQFSNNSPHFRYLLTNHNVEAFVEMTAQGKPIGIRLAGFEGLMALDAQTGLECGLRIALSENPATFAMAEMYAEIADFPVNTQYNKSLTEAFRSMPVRPDSASALINLLPILRLQAWFEAPDRGWVIPTYEALVLGRLYAEFEREGKPPTERMRSTLARFAEIPGIPRAKFLARWEEPSPRYKHLMELSLEDDLLPETSLRGLVAARASYITRTINLDRLKLSEERRKRIKHFLEDSEK